MSEIKTGGPAYPTPRKITSNAIVDQTIHTVGGMTLRDYFAAHALQGGLAHNRPAADMAGWAKWAYQVADAMLAAREKGGAA